jgi:hypothetical protein
VSEFRSAWGSRLGTPALAAASLIAADGVLEWPAVEIFWVVPDSDLCVLRQTSSVALRTGGGAGAGVCESVGCVGAPD